MSVVWGIIIINFICISSHLFVFCLQRVLIIFTIYFMYDWWGSSVTYIHILKFIVKPQIESFFTYFSRPSVPRHWSHPQECCDIGLTPYSGFWPGLTLLLWYTKEWYMLEMYLLISSLFMVFQCLLMAIASLTHHACLFFWSLMTSRLHEPMQSCTEICWKTC